jgi:thiol-disulfide isomerase/thioredoxin
MRTILYFFFIFSGYVVTAQDAPAPSYLVTQDFPDSVKYLPVESFDGKTIVLKDVIETYAGKTIVLDIWASWCRDCIVGVPVLNEMINAPKHKEKAFVFISIDEDAAKWRAAIKRYKIDGHHYRIAGGWKNPLAHYVVLDWVPRYMIFDGEGRIVHPKAVNSDALKTLLAK